MATKVHVEQIVICDECGVSAADYECVCGRGESTKEAAYDKAGNCCWTWFSSINKIVCDENCRSSFVCQDCGDTIESDNTVKYRDCREESYCDACHNDSCGDGEECDSA